MHNQFWSQQTVGLNASLTALCESLRLRHGFSRPAFLGALCGLLSMLSANHSWAALTDYEWDIKITGAPAGSTDVHFTLTGDPNRGEQLGVLVDVKLVSPAGAAKNILGGNSVGDKQVTSTWNPALGAGGTFEALFTFASEAQPTVVSNSTDFPYWTPDNSKITTSGSTAQFTISFVKSFPAPDQACTCALLGVTAPFLLSARRWLTQRRAKESPRASD